MSSVSITLLVCIFLILAGYLYKLGDANRPRKLVPFDGAKPEFTYRTLQPLGGFRYMDGTTIYYLCFCLGPFPLLPIGCFAAKNERDSENHELRTYLGKQRWNFWEVLALYLRWAWLVGIIALITLMVQ